MTTKDAINSIAESNKTISDAIIGIKESVKAMNDNLIYHRELLQDNKDLLNKNTAQINAILKIFYISVLAIIALAGFEKGIKLWDLL